MGQPFIAFLVPELDADISFGRLFNDFKQQYDMILLGFSQDKSGNNMSLNPTSEEVVKSRYHLYYIANERVSVDDINWKSIA